MAVGEKKETGSDWQKDVVRESETPANKHLPSFIYSLFWLRFYVSAEHNFVPAAATLTRHVTF